MFFSPPNQLGKVNELLIKPDLSDLTEEKEEEDVVEECVEEQSGFKADCVFTATSLEAALNLVITSVQEIQSRKLSKNKNPVACESFMPKLDDVHFQIKSLTPVFSVSSTSDKRGE